MMPSNSTARASKPAPGTPWKTNPRPTSSIWINAMPTTPSATARMVAVHSAAILGPRSGPLTREAICTAARLPDSPWAMKMPAMIKAKMKTRNPMPTPASLLSTVRLATLICGRYLAARSGRLVEASSHKADSRWPISGQLATDSAGGGMRKVSALTTSIARVTESAIDMPSR
ncbi:hypothetical protein D3C73_1254990 [compost metagenome]